MAQATTQRRAMPKGPMRGRGMPIPKGSIPKGTLGRLLKTAFKYYKWRLIVVFVCILVSSTGSLISSLFMKTLIDEIIPKGVEFGFAAAARDLLGLILFMGGMYGLVVLTTFLYNRMMATVTQGLLYHLRTDMFKKMQTLPIKYFDTHAHGEIMSTYTNDTDATRQLIGQSLPSVMSNVLTLLVSLGVMLTFSFWLSLVVFGSTLIMLFIVKKIGGNSAKYMIAQQTSIEVEEGFVEEMMKGQKVVKVFTHE